MRRIQILLLAALTVLATAAFPQAPASRQEALAGLASANASMRAAAVVWIARNGAAGDASPLYERLRDESSMVRAYAEQALWMLWSRSGDEAVDRLLERGIDEMHSGRHAEAIATFSEVIRRKPAFAEGWNKRATALYLAGEYQRSLADCAEVIKRNPRHFGALSGAGLVSLELEQERQALDWFRRALEVNPNMSAIQVEARRLEELLRGRSI
ncbi:MAG TPA: tetratricopeptide repeat protein [Burkholderiales bacterium]|jgi:tetratricopeptide (TPR) repeat protein|nr:tetratricopeptide repeat protein [Burkholderiales bacterium]